MDVFLSQVSGPCEIEFEGETEAISVNIKRVVVNYGGTPIYIESVTGVMFNWDKINWIRKE